MSPFTLSPTTALYYKNASKSRKRIVSGEMSNNRRTTTMMMRNGRKYILLFVATAVCCLVVAISKYRQQEQHQHQQHQSALQLLREQEKKKQTEKLSLLFLGTATAHATTAKSANSMVSIRSPSPSSSVTMMFATVTAGSRTLIEIGTRENNDDDDDVEGNASSPRGYTNFQIDVSYMNEDDENGLLILRRANIDDDGYCYYEEVKGTEKHTKTVSCDAINSGHHSFSSISSDHHPFVHNVVAAVKNPILASVLIGNVASMIGLLPMGVSGFLPAVSVTIGLRMKWMVRPFLVALKRSKGIRWSSFSKIRNRIIKAVSKTYNVYTWYVPSKNE